MNWHGRQLAGGVEPGINLVLDLGHHSGEIRAGISQDVGGTAQSCRVPSIELYPVFGRDDRKAVQSRNRPSCASDRFSNGFLISSPDNVWQAKSSHFVLDKDSGIGKVSN